ncbi:MAG: ImmA/IrrE family metallo-endopeptidase [Anaerovoracaceae bacterium]
MDIKNIVQTLCKKHKTINPYHLAGSLGIYVHYCDLGTLRGYYHESHRIKQIFIHDSLPEHIESFVLAHEIGHTIMHPHACTPFLQSTLFSVDRLEVQANKFAAELIIQDIDLMEHWDYTVDQWATVYGLPREIIELRLR